jgi:sulfur-oxidizing protein SoxY
VCRLAALGGGRSDAARGPCFSCRRPFSRFSAQAEPGLPRFRGALAHKKDRWRRKPGRPNSKHLAHHRAVRACSLPAAALRMRYHSGWIVFGQGGRHAPAAAPPPGEAFAVGCLVMMSLLRNLLVTLTWMMLSHAVAEAQNLSAADLKAAREAKGVSGVMAALKVSATEPGRLVLLDTPDIVLAGRPVAIKVTSRLPGTDWIAVLAEPNESPFLQAQEFSPGLGHSLALTTSLRRTGRVRALVRASGKYYEVAREIKLATAGCEAK